MSDGGKNQGRDGLIEDARRFSTQGRNVGWDKYVQVKD
jgi:hypothetical protein